MHNTNRYDRARRRMQLAGSRLKRHDKNPTTELFWSGWSQLYVAALRDQMTLYQGTVVLL